MSGTTKAFDVDRWFDEHLIRESADTLVQLREVGDASAIGEQQGTRREVVLIEAGWGSSGYYSEALLKRDGPSAWPKGTQMFLDHPSVSEEHDRPERSVKDLAAVLATDPVMKGKQLVAEADIFEHWSPVINGLAENIGLSIRAAGEMEAGEAEGRNGNIITALTEGISVDFVTQAGAGGKVGKLIESARKQRQEPTLDEARNTNDYMQSRIHSHATTLADSMYGDGRMTRDERKGVSAAIGQSLDAFHKHIKRHHPALLLRDPNAVVAPPPDSPPLPPGLPPVTASEVLRAAEEQWEPGADRTQLLKEAQERTNQSRSGGGKESAVEVDEKQLSELRESQRQLEEKVKENETKLSEATTRAERAEDALLQSKARGLVERTIREGQEGENPLPNLPERATERVIERSLQGKLPVDGDGKLIESELVERVRAAAKAEHEYLAPASSNGRVQGTGATVTESGNGSGDGDDKPLTEAEQKELQESFKRIGMSDEAAKIAAEGR